MQKWMVASKKADFTRIGVTFGIDPVIARLIRNRDIIGDDQIRHYLEGRLDDIPSPWQMAGMEEAAELLSEKIRQKKPIRIIGDYDIDGVMAVFILSSGLARLGAVLDSKIPDRITDGYGLNEHMIEQAKEDGIDTIITCDNGIAAREPVRLAREYGITVVVTDHHDIPFEEKNGKKTWILPPANVILNPKQEDCTYPYKNICGAVVAWKLVFALYQKNGIDMELAWKYLPFAAIATVGDVMELQGENRILVKEGLKAIPQTENVGLQALLQAAGLEDKEISAYHVGFVIGPCINACGRLDSAHRALELFMEEDKEKAAQIAGELRDLNESRKAMTEEGVEAAVSSITESMLHSDKVLVIYLPECHESIAGIIAGRIRETYHRPCFILTKGEKCVKGSGRSIEEYPMYEELNRCSDLLEQFGGHPMAAGLSLKEENVDILRRRLNANCTLTQEQLAEKIMIDAAMPIAYISRKLVNQISLLEPFGKGNEKPLFAQKDLHVVDCRVLGKNSNVLRMRVSDSAGFMMSAVYFGNARKFYNDLKDKRRIAATYYPEINSYLGRETLQIVIQNYKVY